MPKAKRSLLVGPTFLITKDNLEALLTPEACSSFRDRLDDIIGAILDHPNALKSRPEPPPPKYKLGNTQFRKLEFRVPGLTGDPGEGRLMYCYNPDKQTISLLMLYTHADFAGRPDSSYLRDLLDNAPEPHLKAMNSR